MAEKNCELLNRELHISVEEFMAWIRNEEAQFPDSSVLQWPHTIRKFSIMYKLMFVAFEHLGYGPIEGLQQHMKDGADQAVEFFTTDWWRANNDDQILMDKHGSAPDWFDPFCHGVLLTALAQRWDDVARICGWLDANVQPEFTAGNLEEAVFQLFICIGASLRAEPMPGVEDLLAKVKECPRKRPLLLCAAWEAALAKDQAAFNKAFKESVTNFLSTSKSVNSTNPIHWVAVFQSIIWLIAEKNGLSFPPLSPKLSAAVVTRKSVGHSWQ